MSVPESDREHLKTLRLLGVTHRRAAEIVGVSVGSAHLHTEDVVPVLKPARKKKGLGSSTAHTPKDELEALREAKEERDHRMKMTETERFWENVDRPDLDSCWEWQAARDDNGYGRFGRKERTHRYVLSLAGIETPRGSHVHHICENKACCNPLHLEVMSAEEHARLTGTMRPIRLVCSSGHWVIGKNVAPGKEGGADRRRCKQCGRDRQARYKERKRAAGEAA